MYEVRFNAYKAPDYIVEFEEESDAYWMYEGLRTSANVESASMTYVDGEGGERELASWSL